MPEKYFRLISSVSWNLLLLTIGSIIFAVGVKAIVVPQGFITGGITGVGLLLLYVFKILSPGIWYLIINVPLFLIGWALVSRRFFFYSVYGMISSAFFMDMLNFEIPIHDPFLVVLAGGTIMGAGAGIVFHSLGSLGGNDIIAITLNQRFGVRMGSYFFWFNVVLFAFSFTTLSVDMVLYSLAMSFVTSQVIDHMMTMFNQRKMAMIISDQADAIAREIHQRIGRGATAIAATGTYTGRRKTLILTVVHNYQIKRLEEAVLTIDPEAFVIMENTFNVLGKGFSKRKVY